MPRRKENVEDAIITYFEEAPVEVAVMLLNVVKGRVAKRERASGATAIRRVGRPNKPTPPEQPPLTGAA